MLPARTALVALAFLGFASAVPAQEKPAAPPVEMTTYYLVLLTRGPKWTPEVTPEIEQLQKDHLANIQRLAESGKLLLAGPFTDGGTLRGVFLFKVGSLDEARALAENDPAVKAGRLAVELHPWLAPAGIHFHQKPKEATMFHGLRTVLYFVPDLAKGKEWYTKLLGSKPYFDEPFYVGFNVGGYELGLVPDKPATTGKSTSVVTYWGVDNVDAALKRLLELGATLHHPAEDVGGGIRHGSVYDPFGNVFGVIENPNFKAE